MPRKGDCVMQCGIFGLQGSGKGVYSVMRIEDCLTTTDKHVITNFAIELHPWLRRLGRRRSRGEKGFLAYLFDKYGQTYDAEKRIHIISDEDMAHFYLWRVTPDGVLTKIDEIRDGKGKIIGFDKDAFAITLPTFYVMDEGWKFLNSRNWQTNDAGIQFYCAQHRKAGDDLDICGQHESQIDKQARVLIQEYHTLVNHKFRKIGMFRQPNMISVLISNEPPAMRSKTLKPLPKLIRFDKVGIGGSFDTAKGAGVQGLGADIERKPKGLPTWMVFFAVIAFGFALVIGAKAMGWGAGKLLVGGFQSKPIQTLTRVPSNMVAKAVAPAVPPAPSGPNYRKSAGSPVETNAVEILEMSGAVMVDGKWKLLLSDGSIVTPGDGRCSMYVPQMGIAGVDGKLVRWQKKKQHHETERYILARPAGGY